MKVIPLTNSDKFAIVDDEDFERVSKHRWYLRFDGRVESRINGKRLYLHRLILNPPRDLEVDHINHDQLDNRRNNLRIATHAQNLANHTKHRNGITSQYKGVCWHKRGKKWEAYITVDYTKIHLGLFTSETSAAHAYDLAALKHFREFSKLNFPERITIE